MKKETAIDSVSGKCVEYLLNIRVWKYFSQQAYLTQGELRIYFITSGFQQSICNHINPGLGGQAALVVTDFPIRDIQVYLRLKFDHNEILLSATAIYSHSDCWYITLSILTNRGGLEKQAKKCHGCLCTSYHSAISQCWAISIYIFIRDRRYLYFPLRTVD